MRITNNMLVKDMLWNANRNLSSMSKKQNELSSGERIQRPSDDPVGITQVLKYKTDIREVEQYDKNVKDALGWLQVSESSLTDVKDILQRVRELAVGAANGTNTPEDTQKVKAEIGELIKEITVLGNSTIAGRYIFSGQQTDEKLFNEDGSYNIDITDTRNTDGNNIGYEISVGEVMEIGVNPVDVFGVIQNDNFFEKSLSRGSAGTTQATRSNFKTTVDLSNDFTAVGEVLDINVDGAVFDVDESTLVVDANNPMTKERFVEALKAATDGTSVLSDVAEVYFDANDQLVIESKQFGSASVITDTTVTAGYSGSTITSGTDASDGVYTTGVLISDAQVAAATGRSDIFIKHDGQQKKIELDLDNYSNVADMITEIQSQVDLAFGTGKVTVTGGDNMPISISAVATNDGKQHQVKTDFVYSKESEMIRDLKAFQEALATDETEVIQDSIAKMDMHLDRVLTVAGEIGGKTNRIEFVSSRLDENQITYTELLSKVQDVDMAEAIMNFKNLENIYRASLSVGSKVIQPSLVDFIK